MKHALKLRHQCRGQFPNIVYRMLLGWLLLCHGMGATAQQQDLVPWGAAACNSPQTPPDACRKSTQIEPASADGRRIVNPIAAVLPGKMPWMVAIGTFSKDSANRRVFSLKCGGTLIHPFWVLTAAHCAIQPDSFAVVAGRLNLSSPTGGAEAIVGQSTHWDFGSGPSSFNHDVALLHLKTALSYPIIQPNHSVRFGKAMQVTVRIAGWGSASNKQPASAQLMYTDIHTIIEPNCNGLYADYDNSIVIPDDSFCAIGLPTQGTAVDGSQLVADACSGDSGGPAISDSGTLVGVVSWGIGCGSAALPGVYAAVAEALPWIEGELAKYHNSW